MVLTARASENRQYEAPPLRWIHRPRLNPTTSPPPPSAPSSGVAPPVIESPSPTPSSSSSDSSSAALEQDYSHNTDSDSNYSLEGGVFGESPTLEERHNFDQDLCNNNEFISKDYCLERGFPIDAFPPSLIKWPLSSNIKSNRVAAVRQQIQQLSKVIKMTIEDGMEETASSNVPFSSYVDLAGLHAHIGGIGHAKDGLLPSWSDFEALIDSGRKKEAKLMLRESNWGINEPIRGKLWRKLGQQHAKEEFTDTFYWETVQQIYGSSELSECDIVLPSFADQRYIISHHLSPEGTKVCKRMLSVIGYAFPAITYAPTLFSIAAVLLHYMSECDAYNCLTAMLSSSNKFIFQTKGMHESMWRAVEILAKKHVRGSFAMLHKYGISSEQVDDGFHNWIWWILAYLPFPHLVRVIDCFMLEGSKVLLRCSLAVFHLFMKNAGRDPNKAAVLTTKGIDQALTLYCQDINVPPCKLLKTAFGIRAFSKAEIQKVVVQAEMLVNSQQKMHDSSMMRASSLEGLNTSHSNTNIQMVSHTLAIKELLMVWSWLPMRMTMRQPTLIYTTEEHGSSITTFYKRIEAYEPFIILIRTQKDDVFGAYCSTALNQRHTKDEFGNRQTYFGTGETFLFVLRPSAKKYEWVGITRQRENAALASVEHSSELFIHADGDMISVGGGNGHGLMVDRELQFGKTESCDTFDNKPLCEDSNFEIKVIEVFALTET